jgi:hypothetical protein
MKRGGPKKSSAMSESEAAERKRQPPSNSGNGKDEDEILRLAKLSTIHYDKEREASAEKLGVRVATLDSAVKVERDKFAKEERDFLPHWNVEPWPEKIDGAALLAELRKHFAALCRAAEARRCRARTVGFGHLGFRLL